MCRNANGGIGDILAVGVVELDNEDDCGTDNSFSTNKTSAFI